ncbi:Bac_transf domain-containing protein [Vibrio chagasii]|nr:Bac_transf domain-containing protein [Vibrio chagasii]CAH6797815.1 Bac_transf domain-containing protein [Vibrio chagasii]CAH7178864.1 Bac_transf domain-containing protein [Vibrio chagasii]CAH7409301.1 Bac_transf domain-containing protein [Vibrio chagasii]
MNLFQCFIKRSFDVVLSTLGLFFLFPLFFLVAFANCVNLRGSCFFYQVRVGKKAKKFKVIKFKTMRDSDVYTTTITSSLDPRITKFGSILRKLKIDELPQLINVFLGHMSFVGPRPDVPGYADTLKGKDRIILSVRPGITGPASIKYKNEEELLAKQDNPQEYNDTVIWPDKVKINIDYIKNYSFINDIKYIVDTIK